MYEYSYLTHLADFLFEAGMLRKTPRTGYQFLGSGGESVAEHSFRTAIVGYVLASMAGADVARTTAIAASARWSARRWRMRPAAKPTSSATATPRVR